jgi:glycerol-1-phosphate dehydrogenase [NAD(P)+]
MSPDGAAAPAVDPIDALLRGAWIDPDTRAPTGVGIPSIVIDDALDGREADLVAPLRLGARIAVVADPTTHDVLGARVARALASIARVDTLVLPPDPHPDAATVERVRERTRDADALVAVGSGTVNDLAKYAAARDRKPYAVFATAPSMNGYTSANAAITVDGHKKTLPAALARGVFVDLRVLSAAPKRLIRAGIGDSLCRSTAQLDWRLSHHLLGTTYRAAPFALLADDEPAWLGATAALLDGDAAAMRALARTLVLSGIGMTLCGGSYPASQGEHLISHYLDMRAGDGPASLHGEQVAVATLTMARLQQAMLAGEAPAFRASGVDERALRAHFGDAVGAACWREFAPKRLDAARAAALTRRASERWDALRRDAAAYAVRAARLEDAMRAAGGPTRPEDLGIDAARYADAVRHARFLRDRYTFLDAADDAGRLDAALH